MDYRVMFRLNDYKADWGSGSIKVSTNLDEDYWQIVHEEVETVLKAKTSAGVDNMPAEIVQAGGEAMPSICNNIRKTSERIQSMITLSIEGNLNQCQIYQTIISLTN